MASVSWGYLAAVTIASVAVRARYCAVVNLSKETLMKIVITAQKVNLFFYTHSFQPSYTLNLLASSFVSHQVMPVSFGFVNYVINV